MRGRRAYSFKSSTYALRSITLLIIGFALQYQAHSLDSFPEYWGFQEDEMGLIGRVEWVDSEYSSDMLTYSISPTWEGAFQRSNHAFDTTIGSLGAKHFFVRRRLKIREELLENINFQLTYFDHSDFDTHQKHLVAEFDTFWNDQWGAAIYTELSYEKRRDDLGFALLFNSVNQQRVRFFYSATDFSRNERNENSDTFAVAPLSYGIVSRWQSQIEADESYFSYGFRIEPKMQLDDPTDSSTYTLQRTYIFYQQLWGSQSSYDYIDLEWKEVEENNSADRKLVRSQINYKGARPLKTCLQYPRCRIIYGIQLSQRKWNLDQDEVNHLDILPHVGYQWLIKETGIIESSLDIGRHEADGPIAIRSNSDENEAYHSRMNLGYEWLFKKGALKIYLTADLDHFSWEGGNGQFQLFF